MASRWDERGVRSLFNGLGAYGLKWFRKKAGRPYAEDYYPKLRSADAIYSKIRREYGKGGLTRGVYTLRQITEATGYSTEHIRRAQSALNQKWKRTSPRGSHLISDEQLEDITAWLVRDYWSKERRLYCCVWCTMNSRPHKAHGLCVRCYPRYRARCKVLGIPFKLAAQSKRVVALAGDNKFIPVTFLEESVSLLRRGVALDEWRLEEIARLYSL